jgi:hypothetical protein
MQSRHQNTQRKQMLALRQEGDFGNGCHVNG